MALAVLPDFRAGTGILPVQGNAPADTDSPRSPGLLLSG